MGSAHRITNHIGYTYSFLIRMGGFLLATVGVAILLTKGWGLLVGAIFIFSGLYFATSSSGIFVDLQRKAVMHYTNILGYRRGNWNEYPTYPFICVVRKNLKKTRFYEAENRSGDASYKFEIYMVSRSHRGKVLIEICYDREDADFRAKRYSEDMNMSVTEYAPPSRTKKKRVHRKAD